ncbi:hypothetical protein [Streptomyces sp. G-G2]|uniref:hypothetical protein n=1 Tax=Streptomyces sp. G-G2 TaxID=3046201 RepID=UPI0024B9B25F|nr:hypothetical protein [Streptomyces sp. G-G2]MDJ0386395.1 hypothetical protein [Streptomyces sp. G-G2]
MTTAPKRFEVLLVPEHVEGGGVGAAADAVRAAVVEATGETGVSGYPRYTGGGMEADIDPATGAVEALLVDGSELDYSLKAVTAPAE